MNHLRIRFVSYAMNHVPPWLRQTEMYPNHLYHPFLVLPRPIEPYGITDEKV
jgi:hypothetical protein